MKYKIWGQFSISDLHMSQAMASCILARATKFRGRTDLVWESKGHITGHLKKPLRGPLLGERQ